MKIIAAPNAFKGSATASDVAGAIQSGVMRVFPDAEVVQLPIADGGDGTLDVIIAAADGQYVEVEVLNPLGEQITAQYGLLDDGKTAVVEMAAASGIRLIDRAELNPMQTTTYGTGQLIKAALDRGCGQVIIGVGGSATVEGGIGMAQALGAKLLDNNGQNIGYGGGGLSQIARIDVSHIDPRVKDTRFIVATDVENPLTGETGAAAVFGPQKGATPEMVTQLDTYLTKYAAFIQRDLGKSVAELAGAGAAGGLAAGLVAFLDAEIQSGGDVVLDLLNMKTHLQNATLVITGEGKIDSQTAYGKGPAAVAKLAKQQHVPVIAIAGCLSDDADEVLAYGIDGLMATVDCPMTLDDAINNAPHLIEKAVARALTLLKIGLSLKEP